MIHFLLRSSLMMECLCNVIVNVFVRNPHAAVLVLFMRLGGEEQQVDYETASL